MSLTISQAERESYHQHFVQAGPINGKLQGLPTHQLGEIWELADIDKDGCLDFDEYCIAIKIVYSILDRSLAGVPQVLPATLVPSTKAQYVGGGSNGTVYGATGTGSMSPPIAQQGPATLEWYVPEGDRAQYQGLFNQHSHGGTTVRMLDVDELLNSIGIPRHTVTQVWGLIDVRKYQQLNQQQFIYLLHVLSACRNGAPVPATLPPAIKDNIYKSLNLDSAGGSQGSNTHGYRYGKSSSPGYASPGGGNSKKPGLYGEKSGNVALADSYLSKLKTSSTFKNEAGSRYASSSKNAEEERKLRAELEELDQELEKLKSEESQGDSKSEEEQGQDSTVKELEELRAFKVQEKKEAENPSGSQAGSTGESLQDLKQSVLDLESRFGFLQAEKRAVEEFIRTGRQELIDLQMEQMDLK
ncbi:endocytosis defective- protein [Linderina macrospora]|uniref:Endocytosis defective- protein n=1 Tax=Linderina macrospora TaxID=4868 RepID=A0ACC1JHS9_9FUNG|nr:endocytosis defective- protein [Linderina macrospora]